MENMRARLDRGDVKAEEKEAIKVADTRALITANE